ncbi:hypothetical protein OAD57_07450 [Porticoccaceae bacterium]|nr:hypothetical protein [Porticoccaceae bacterium]
MTPTAFWVQGDEPINPSPKTASAAVFKSKTSQPQLAPQKITAYYPKKIDNTKATKMRSNKKIVEDFYHSIVAGDMDLYSSVIHENIELSMPVREGVLTGTYRGKARLVGEVFPHVVSQLDNDNFVFCKQFKIMSEDANCIVAICEAEGQAANGERYDQIYAHFFNFQDGQISRLIEFSDTGLADRTIWKGVAPIAPDAEFVY